jgi:raffinose/stachyose/melibiose transport system permease protein
MSNSSVLRPKTRIIAAYMAPAVIIYLFLVVVPLALSVWMSFYNWSGVNSSSFIGFKNYADLLRDRVFLKSLENNLLIVVYAFIGQVGLGLIISLLLCNKFMVFREFHRRVIFLPVVLSPVVIGFVWLMVYNKDFGILNYFLNALGLSSWIHPWLDDPKGVVLGITIPLIWQYIGFNLIIFLSSIQSIPPEIIECAEIDGATGIRKTWHIVMPMIMNTFKVVVMLCISGNMKIFDHIYVMTSGGPGSASMVMALYNFKVSFRGGRYGYGCAISMAIVVVSLVLIFLSRKLIRGEQYD